MIKALWTDSDNNPSIGRIMLWISFAILCFFWIKTAVKIDVNVTLADAPDSLQFVFLTLVGYELGKKARDVFKYSVDIKNKIINTDGTNGQ